MKVLKNQRGSATLFVLIAVLFFSVILLNMYRNNINKIQTQSKDITEIKNSYKKDIDEVYEKEIEKEENKE